MVGELIEAQRRQAPARRKPHICLPAIYLSRHPEHGPAFSHVLNRSRGVHHLRSPVRTRPGVMLDFGKFLILKFPYIHLLRIDTSAPASMDENFRLASSTRGAWRAWPIYTLVWLTDAIPKTCSGGAYPAACLARPQPGRGHARGLLARLTGLGVHLQFFVASRGSDEFVAIRHVIGRPPGPDCLP